MFFDLEEPQGTNCHNDFLQIKDKKYCGKEMNRKTSNFTTSGGFVVHFRSDLETQKGGFAIRISSPQVTTTSTTTTTTTTSTTTTTTTSKPITKPATGKPTGNKMTTDKLPDKSKQG